MNAYGRRKGLVADVMGVAGTECVRLAGMDHARPLTGTMLLKDAVVVPSRTCG